MRRKRSARKLVVRSNTQLTQNMRRLTLQGEELASFPENAEGAYFKLTFPGSDPESPVLRTYTVSRHRPELCEIDVDFMLHGYADGSSSGVAVSWAAQAQPGDPMSIFGPGPATFINTRADWFLLAADMTALPALTANLAHLPSDAKGFVVVEIIANEDRQELPVPSGMEVVWVVNPMPGSDEAPLYHAIKGLEWRTGQVAIWAACEFTTMKKTRQYFRNDRNVKKSHVYISSYWKRGLQEEAHKEVKRRDAA